jgi:hypothetical protein
MYGGQDQGYIDYPSLSNWIDDKQLDGHFYDQHGSIAQ